MVGVGMDFKDIGQHQAQPVQLLQVATEIMIYRVDNDGTGTAGPCKI